jgi:hypothetical protein
MERLTENRKAMRHILAQHYVEGHLLGEDAGTWLLRFGGWFPDPQMPNDGFARDPGVDEPCADVDEGLAAASLILMLNGSAPRALEEIGPPWAGQALPGGSEAGDCCHQKPD